jgi:hypothetical protein
VTRAQKWLLHLSNALVGVTGLVYGWMRYFAESDDPFAIANHPWQPEWQHAHILTAPLLLFAVGWMWSNHVLVKIRSGAKSGRRSGLLLVAFMFPMVFSGYLLQTANSEAWREAWVAVHVCTSVVWFLAAVVHPFLPSIKIERGSQSES